MRWKLPDGRTHWGIDRRDADAWVVQTFANPKGGRSLRWMKLELLTEARLREHFGVGHFRLWWHRRGLSDLAGPEFDISPDAPINTSAPPTVADPSAPLADAPAAEAPRGAPAAMAVLSALPVGSEMNIALASMYALRNISMQDEERAEARRQREHEREMLSRKQQHEAQMQMIREQGESQRESQRQLHAQQMEAQRIALTPAPQPAGLSADELEDLIDERLDELEDDDDDGDDKDPKIKSSSDALRYFMKLAVTEPEKAQEVMKLIPGGLRMIQDLGRKPPIIPKAPTGNGSTDGGAAAS